MALCRLVAPLWTGAWPGYRRSGPAFVHYRVIAEGQAEGGNIDKAVPIARGIEDASQRSWALTTIAARQAKASDIEGAIVIREASTAITGAR